MVMAGRSDQLTTLFHGQAVNQYFVHILSLVTDNNPAEGRRMTVEIISCSMLVT